MYRKKLLQRIGISFIALITTFSMTACSVGMKPITDVPDTTETIICELQDAIDSYSDESFIENPENLSEELSEICIDSGYDLQVATLIRVVDGDTIVVDIDGEKTKVRLIGIDTPESVASEEYLEQTGKENTSTGKYASDWLKEFLADYTTLYLQKDVSDTDQYGRALRYVWISAPKDIENIEEIRTKMLNGILLDQDIAKTVVYEPDTHYLDAFISIETKNTDLYEIFRE